MRGICIHIYHIIYNIIYWNICTHIIEYQLAIKKIKFAVGTNMDGPQEYAQQNKFIVSWLMMSHIEKGF